LLERDRVTSASWKAFMLAWRAAGSFSIALAMAVPSAGPTAGL
jgi:hypothetical protein